MTWDVILYDEHQSWSPSINASARDGKGIGGWEVFQVQIASWLAAAGYRVWAINPGSRPDRHEKGVYYGLGDPADTVQCRALILGRHSRIPDWIQADKTVTSAVDDPTHTRHDYDHLKGKSLIVCISEWQAVLYRDLGHDAIAIPSMISDEIYARPRPASKRGMVCVSAWNKGTDATLALYADMRRRWPALPDLYVGSPYGAPMDAARRVQHYGAKYLGGALKPGEVVSALEGAEAVFRVCIAPETFGVTDAIAEVVGTRVHALFTRGLGASREVLASSYLTEDSETFEVGVLKALGKPATQPKSDYRVSTIMPRWLPVLGLT